MVTSMQGTKKIIALIEDDRSIHFLYKARFKRLGHTIVGAYDGVEGLHLIKETKPDVILLDLLMPEMGGEEMLRRLRNTDWGEHIPVIVMTNVSRDEAPLSLRSLGVRDYLVKALYTPSQIAEKVLKVLDQQ